VYVDRVTVQRHGLDGNPAGDYQEIDAQRLLGTRVIPPAGITVPLRFDTAREAAIFSIEHAVVGRTAEGWSAVGAFSIMRPPKRPTRDDHVPVDDPMLQAKILAARDLLGKEFVTDEDLWRLEREGAFKGLQPSPVRAEPQVEPTR
jgi:hypothetical protein